MSISKALFMKVWEAMEKRFGEQPPGSAGDYLSFLDLLLTDEEFTEAGRAVWATREFFPRPADFLMVRQGRDWALVQEAAELARRKKDWGELFQSMSSAGQMSIKALGGIFVVDERMQRNPGLTRSDFGTQYEVAITTLASEGQLQPGSILKRIAESG
jgi:hypothetical protein